MKMPKHAPRVDNLKYFLNHTHSKNLYMNPHVLVPIIQPVAVSISLGPAVGQEPIKFIVSYLKERGVVCVGTVDISVHQPF